MGEGGAGTDSGRSSVRGRHLFSFPRVLREVEGFFTRGFFVLGVAGAPGNLNCIIKVRARIKFNDQHDVPDAEK
jgi:hypothetical protein